MSALAAWWRRLPPARVDAIAAALVAVGGLIELVSEVPATDRGPATLVVMAVAYGCLAFRRSHPLPAGAAMLSLFAFTNIVLTDLGPVQIPLFAVLASSYAMARYAATARMALLALGIVITAMIVVVATMAGQNRGDFVFPTAFAVIAWVAGRAVRTRATLTAELHEAAALAEEAHEQASERAAADERRRIAREMHDVVAHSVSVMVVQAGGARRILDQDPQRAIEAATHIEQTGRAALVEMRRLLGMLGQHDDTRAPQPTLAALGDLVAGARAAGLAVDLAVDGEPVALAPGLDLAAYRVVQEGLTNALRHAGGSPVDVGVRWADGALELAIADRGPGPADEDGAADGEGHGLVGMRERVRLYGGELWTGRREGGGFEIRARIPLELEAA